MLSDTAPTGRAATPIGVSSAHQLLLAEFIHRSANDFAVACAEVCVARRMPTLERARDRLEILMERLLSLASIQRLLQCPNAAEIDLGKALCELCHHHAQARFAEQGVFVRVRCDDVSVDSRRGWALLMIVSELLTNAARHAFDGPRGLVDVILADRDGEIRCVVHDDGVGASAAKASPGAGTAIVDALARDAGIRCQGVSCAKGTMIELRMPSIF